MYKLGQSAALRVISVLPGTAAAGIGMIFARRQVDELQAAGVMVHKFYLATRTDFLGVIREWRRLRQEVTRFNPDVIHCHYGTMTAFLAVFSTAKPVVVTYRGSDLNPVPSATLLRTFFGHMLSQIAALRARRIICVSRELSGRLLWGGNKLMVLPTGVDMEVFFPIQQHEARRRLGWETDAPVVLFNAGNSPQVKRLDLAEAAVAEAKRSLPGMEFVVLRGEVSPEDVPLYLNAANVLLVTSDYEGSPTIVQEAVACGLPVVAVDVGDVREILTEVSPSLIAVREPAVLGAAILEILALNKRSNGPEIAAKYFDKRVLLPKILNVLLAAAKRGEPCNE